MSTAQTILLVEDDSIVALVEARQLKQEGYSVIHAYNGEEAISKVKTASPAIDLILMDINLGRGLDGTEAAQIILQDYDIPIVFLSSHTEPEIVAKTEKITSYGYVVKNTGTTVLAASIKMAFKLHAANQTIKCTNESLSLAQKSSNAGTWDWDIAHNTFRWSPEFLKVFGMSADTIAGFDVWRNTVHPEDLENAERQIQEAINNNSDLANDYRIVWPNGEIRWIRATGRTYYANNQPMRMAGLCMDITAHKQMEDALSESEERYRRLIEGAPDIVYIFSSKRGGIYYSPHVEQVLGYPIEHMYAHPMLWNESVHPDDHILINEAIREFENGKPFDIEYRVQDAQGKWRWLRDRSIGCRVNGNDVLIEGLATDITERKQAEEALRQALAEKEILMRELQHRVKNSLAIAVSLIDIEQDHLSDDHSRAVSTNIQARLRTMSILYAQLNQEKSLDRVDMAYYLQALVEMLSQAYLSPDSPVKVETYLATLELDAHHALTLGLIVNELVTNALKYAFPARRPGIIRIKLEETADSIVLCVADNGVGVASSPSHSGGVGMGLMLVEMLARQLDGQLTLESEQGTTVRVTFGK